MGMTVKAYWPGISRAALRDAPTAGTTFGECLATLSAADPDALEDHGLAALRAWTTPDAIEEGDQVEYAAPKDLSAALVRLRQILEAEERLVLRAVGMAWFPEESLKRLPAECRNAEAIADWAARAGATELAFQVSSGGMAGEEPDEELADPFGGRAPGLVLLDLWRAGEELLARIDAEARAGAGPSLARLVTDTQAHTRRMRGLGFAPAADELDRRLQPYC